MASRASGVFARVDGVVGERVVRIEARAAGVLGDQGVHDREHDFAADALIGVDVEQAGSAVAIGLGEAAPVVEVGDGHVVDRAGHAAAGFIGEHRDIDDLGDLLAEHSGEVARGTELVGFDETLAELALLFVEEEVAPDELAQHGRGELRRAIEAARLGGMLTTW